jgi:hypothetical protein
MLETNRRDVCVEETCNIIRDGKEPFAFRPNLKGETLHRIHWMQWGECQRVCQAEQEYKGYSGFRGARVRVVFILGLGESRCECRDDNELNAEDVGCGDKDLPATESSGDEERGEGPRGVGEGVKNGVVEDLFAR